MAREGGRGFGCALAWVSELRWAYAYCCTERSCERGRMEVVGDPLHMPEAGAGL